jgi:phosphatidylinositol alpha-mannosyltransferase
VSLLALWHSRTTVVATFHTATSRSAVLSAAGALLRPSLGRIAARIAVSDSARETLVHHLGGRTPAVIANGIFCDRFASALALPEWTSPAPTIAFLGRTDEPRKGLALLLKAFGEVLSAYPTARLLVAGYGRAAAVRRLPEHVRRQVEVLGQLSDSDRARLLASATVFVAPQLGGESFGVVLAEAMAAGAPVVASDLPPFRSMLDGSRLGELFAAGDAQGAADAICRVLGSTARRDCLRRRAAAAVRRYDWSDVVPEIEAVYESVASVRTTGRAS